MRPRAQSNRDAELDRALRELGDELLTQEIPERLLRVLREAARNEGAGDRDEDMAAVRPGRMSSRGR